MMLVSLAQASSHLRRDTSDDDSDLTLKIKAASAAVLNYIDDNFIFLDSAGEPAVDSAGIAVEVPEDIQAATLLLIGYFYRDRDFDTGNQYSMGYLPAPVTALLYPYRTPGCR